MGKAPAFQFYPGDWFREPGLKRVDLSVRGAWAELLMIMWDENPQGRIDTHLEGYGKMLRIDPLEAGYIICELDENKIADVKYFDENCKKFIQDCRNFKKGLSRKCPDVSQNSPAFVTVTNRRMYNAWKVREYERLRKQDQRERKAKKKVSRKSPGKVPLYSSSSSSSIHISAKKLIEFLNEISGRKFTIKANIDYVIPRLKDGYTFEQCKSVIEKKWRDPDFNPKYFCPETLFRKSKFEKYLNEDIGKKKPAAGSGSSDSGFYKSADEVLRKKGML